MHTHPTKETNKTTKRKKTLGGIVCADNRWCNDLLANLIRCSAIQQSIAPPSVFVVMTNSFIKKRNINISPIHQVAVWRNLILKPNSGGLNSIRTIKLRCMFFRSLQKFIAAEVESEVERMGYVTNTKRFSNKNKTRNKKIKRITTMKVPLHIYDARTKCGVLSPNKMGQRFPHYSLAIYCKKTQKMLHRNVGLLHTVGGGEKERTTKHSYTTGGA